VHSFELRGPAGRLEAVLNEGSPDARFAAVVCHPHPLGGGSLHNKVVYNAMKVLNASEWGFEWPVLRFNFRGTGRSEGEHDGAAETGDVLAALAWLESKFNLPLVVAGFSFGAAMALAACCERPGVPCSPISADKEPPQIWGTQDFERNDVRAIAALGLPVRSGADPLKARVYDYSHLAQCPIPKLFLSGDRDRFAAKAELIQAAAAAAEPRQVALVPGADHFFTGHLAPMQAALARWLKEQVYDPGQQSQF
jgi:alpha/beta superfamily hydrolase